MQVPAKIQIVHESLKRVIAVPYLVSRLRGSISGRMVYPSDAESHRADAVIAGFQNRHRPGNVPQSGNGFVDGLSAVTDVYRTSGQIGNR